MAFTTYLRLIFHEEETSVRVYLCIQLCFFWRRFDKNSAKQVKSLVEIYAALNSTTLQTRTRDEDWEQEGKQIKNPSIKKKCQNDQEFVF